MRRHQITADGFIVPSLPEGGFRSCRLTNVGEVMGLSYLHVKTSMVLALTTVVMVFSGGSLAAQVTTNLTITATFTHRLALAIQPWPGPMQRRGFLLLLAGDEGNTCSVKSSPDSFDWQPLTTLTISNTAVQFIDLAVTNHSPRFYRGVLR